MMTGKGWAMVFGGATLAFLIAAFSCRLAFGKIEKIKIRDSATAESLAREVRQELNRLDHRYEFYLREILASYQSESDLRTQSLCSETIGVTRVSLVISEDVPGDESTLPVDPDSSIPTLRKGKLGAARNQILLDPDLLPMNGSIDSGWIYGNAGEMLYWQRFRKHSAKVLTIDTVRLRDSINQWFTSPESNLPFELLSMTPEQGTDRIVDPTGRVVWQNHEQDWSGRSPTRSLPLRGQVGMWRLESLDPSTTLTQWNYAILIPGLILSGLIGILSAITAIAYSRAEHLSRQRVSFVNQASHELRTPITNILLNSELAADAVDSEPDEAIARIKLVGEETGRLSRLVDNLLTFSQGEQNCLRIVKSPVIPDQLICQVLSLFDSSFERLGFEVETCLQSPDLIKTDPDALAQILTNLISNVEKYAKQGKRICIRSEIDREYLSITIEDDGPGISKTSVDRIFEPFYRQSNQVTEGVSGTGLGLSISRALAGKLGGKLELIPSDTGSRFRLVIPI